MMIHHLCPVMHDAQEEGVHGKASKYHIAVPSVDSPRNIAQSSR